MENSLIPLKSDAEVELFNTIDPNLPLVLIDLDHTMIDTTKVTEWLKQRIHDLGFSQADIDRTYEQAKNENGAYDLDKHVQLLCDCSKESAAETAEKIYSACPVQQAIFPDAHDFLEQNSTKANIVMFTLGAKQIQQAKLNCAHISQHLKGVIYTLMNKAELLNADVEITDRGVKVDIIADETFPRMLVIDDHPRAFIGINENLQKGLQLIRIRRAGEKYADLVTPEFVTQVSGFSSIRV